MTSSTQHKRGVALIAGAACFWSTGGLIARHIETDQWNIMFYRGIFAALTLLGFLLWRDGRQLWALFRNLKLPGLAVALCFGIAACSFVVALQHAKVATIFFIESSSPFIAGLLAWVWLGEKPTPIRSLGMVLAFSGIMIMISGDETGSDPWGIFFSFMIVLSFAMATVIVRRYQHIRMTPATCLSSLIVALVGLSFGTPGTVGGPDIFLLFLFGSVQLGAGFILFTYGARLIPAGEATLLSLLESILSPLWVWLWPSLHEYPGDRALIGGTIVLSAVSLSTWLEMRHKRGNKEMSAA